VTDGGGSLLGSQICGQPFLVLVLEGCYNTSKIAYQQDDLRKRRGLPRVHASPNALKKIVQLAGLDVLLDLSVPFVVGVTSICGCGSPVPSGIALRLLLSIDCVARQARHFYVLVVCRHVALR
jgi:hypothetical protein